MTVPTPLGATSNIVPELAIVEALSLGFVELTQDRAALEQCVVRTDALRYATTDRWKADMIATALDFVDPTSDRALKISLSYSEAIAVMPALSVELASDNEDEGKAVFADELARQYEIRNPVTLPSADPAAFPVVPVLSEWEQMSVCRQALGVGWNSSVLIGCWEPGEERALLLQALTRAALFRQKGFLFGRGVEDIQTSAGARKPTEDMQGRLAFIPTITVRMRWTYRTTRSKIVPNRVTLGTVTFTS